MDSVNFAEAARNNGLVKRRLFSAGSRTFDMMGRMHADIFFRSITRSTKSVQR